MISGLPARGQVPFEYTWDTGSVFSSDQAWEEEIERLVAALPQARAFQDRLGESAVVLADWFELAERIQRMMEKIRLYASMRHHVDTADQQAAAQYDRARSLQAQVGSALAFAEPQLLQVGANTLRRWVQQEPRLAHMGHYVDRLERRKDHVRSAEVEGLLGQVMDVFNTATAIHGVLSDADLSFSPARGADGTAVEIGQGSINKLLISPDRALRRSAWENYADGYLAFKNTLANCIATGVKRDVFLARSRGYGSCLEAALSPQSIPVAVFENLIAAFKKHLPTWHRYWRLRRRALGDDALHVYDARAPLSKKTSPVSFAQAVGWICEGMSPLGTEYVDVMRKGVMEQRWVDIYPNKGKRMGAFSTGVQGAHPFIMMSYSDNLLGLSTLAHELGHSMHSYYTWKTQPQAYASYSLFVAEVASNFNQALVRAHLLKTQDDAGFQLEVLEEAMANFHRYFFIMPTLARFELEIHRRVEGGMALTADDLISLMADLFGEGYGAEVKVDRERVGITWAQFATHLYSNFYVYQYATGISGAHALAQRVLDKRSEAVQSYLGFLKAGGSQYPLDALCAAGVDLASPAPVERAFEALVGYVDRLERLLSAV